MQPPKPPPGEWISMGRVCVDTGTLAIVDPCFGHDEGDIRNRDWSKHFWPYANDFGVTFCTGFGDGWYEVWGKLVDFGRMGVRVAEVRISMISDEDVEEDD